jgi:hypothetical protein
MKHIGTTLSTLVLAGSLAGSAMAGNDGVLVKDQAGENYCHIKFPAIREDTLGWQTPVLKDSSSSDVIDFYGPCDESPSGKDQVAAQRLQDEIRFENNYD